LELMPVRWEEWLMPGLFEGLRVPLCYPVNTMGLKAIQEIYMSFHLIEGARGDERSVTV
jgi:hypothetical protein